MTTFNVLRIDAYARFDHKDAKIQIQKFKFGTRSAVQIEFCQIAFQPNPPSSKRTLLFLSKISHFFKTAVLTMGMDILTMTMVKHYS